MVLLLVIVCAPPFTLLALFLCWLWRQDRETKRLQVRLDREVAVIRAYVEAALFLASHREDRG